MSSLLRTVVLSGVVAVLPLALSARAQSVHTDYDHHANFANYHTYCIDRVHAANPLYEGRLRDSLNYRLSRVGLTNAKGAMRIRRDRGPAPVETPAGCDLSVRAIGSVRNQQEYSTFYNGFGPGWGYGGWGGGYGGWGGWDGGPAITQVEQIPVGTLVVDLYDAHTKRLVFRGVSSTDVSSHADTNTRRLNISIDKMFQKFPPKTKE